MTITTQRWADVLDEHPALGKPMFELPTPAPLIDLDVLERNIATMASFFAAQPARLRAHVKTHRAPAIARMQVAAGSHGITAPKVSVAEAMVDGGIDDVYVANQVVTPWAIARLTDLAKRATVAVVVDDARNVAALSEAAHEQGVTLDVLIEVDGGMGRCGVQPGKPSLALTQAVERAPGLRFAGIHVYEGHVVQDADAAVRKAETEKMLDRALDARDLIEQNGISVETVTCGGTGTYDISGIYPGVTEHQAGSYVYMDPGYASKVPAFGLAFSLLCTVVSRPSPEKVITDGGLQVLSSGGGTPAAKDHPELEFRHLSEEHGSFLIREGEQTALDIGDQIEVHPGHCCAAANLHDQVFGVRNGQVETVWLATARGKSQ
jgi:D-serine deaminase-like pyridoxal phosphate-dependent protein